MAEYDAMRTGAYLLYEQMYWGDENTFKEVQRGTNLSPIFIPTCRTVIEATNRYLAVDWSYYLDPALGTDSERAELKLALDALFKRERLKSKFAQQKRYGLIRGDAIWHVVADPLKPEGSRISIYALDPASYFPIYAKDDLDKIVGCHIVDQIIDEVTGDPIIRRLTYRKDAERPGVITSELKHFEAGWDDREGIDPSEVKLLATPVPLHDLPPEVTSLPVYHWKNTNTPADPYGSSELRGLERIQAAINQTISDQDLAVALTGLGVYTTTSSRPLNDDGEETNWMIGPGYVVEHSKDTTFERVNGITSVQPSLDHANYLETKLEKAAGVPAIATGDAEVQAAESGIALYLRLSPLLSKNKEKELELLGVMDNMLYDLARMWFPAYEGKGFGEAVPTSIVADPMPVNRDARIAEILSLATSTPPLITMQMAQDELAAMGYTFTADAVKAIIQQTTDMATAGDPFAARASAELADDPAAPDAAAV